MKLFGISIFEREGNLLKARSTKYYKRVPTGNPKRPWKYYYSKESYEKEHGKGAGEKVEKTKQAILDGLLSLEGTQRWQKKGQDRVYVSRADSRFLSAEDQAELPQQSRTLYYDVKKGEFIVSGFGDKVKAVLNGIKNAIMGKQPLELSAEDVARNEAVTLPEDQSAAKVGEVEPVQPTVDLNTKILMTHPYDKFDADDSRVVQSFKLREEMSEVFAQLTSAQDNASKAELNRRYGELESKFLSIQSELFKELQDRENNFDTMPDSDSASNSASGGKPTAVQTANALVDLGIAHVGPVEYPDGTKATRIWIDDPVRDLIGAEVIKNDVGAVVDVKMQGISVPDKVRSDILYFRNNKPYFTVETGEWWWKSKPTELTALMQDTVNALVSKHIEETGNSFETGPVNSEDNFDTMPEEEGGMEDNPGKDEYNDQLDIFKDAQPEEKKLAETPAIKDKEKLKQVREYASDKNTDDSYRYQDIGYVPGSRKEEAANQIRIRSKEGKRITAELIDWLSLEKNPREAEKLINKKTLFGEVNWADYEARGVDPAAAFLIGRIYAAIPKDPLIKSQTGRFYYTKGINEVRDRFDNCTSVEGVKEALDDLYDQFTGVSFLPDEAERMQEIKKQFREIREREDAYREFSRKAYDEYDAIYSKNEGIKYEYVKAERRGWKNKLPELKEAADRADAETKAAWEAYRAKLEAHPEYAFFKTESKPYDPKTGKEITEEEAQKYEREIDVNTPSGISYRKIIQQAPRRSMGPAEDIRFALNKEAKTIQENARERHINSEQFAVIASLGEDFYKTLNYRSGKTAFSKHYAQAKAGKIKDYSWAEKGTTSGRTATKQSARFQLKVADRYNREGGRPVAIESSKDYTDKFRFRAVQSGNYVLNDFNAAKFHIERSAEAYVDLADFLGIPEHYVSLGGELAMAFGARGRGTEGWKESAARAHYEPTYRVINITKNSGGGSLGHEWVHAVDNILALQEREKTGVDKDEYSDSVFVSENPAIIESARVRSAVEKLVSVMEAGDLPETMKYEAKPVSQSMVERNIKGQLAKKWFASGDYATTVREIQNYFGMQDLLQVKYKELSRMEKKRLRAAKSWVDVAVAYYTQNYNGGQVQIPTGNTVSKFLKWAQDTDGGAGPGKKYWSSRHELFARAFQSYIEDGLAVDGRKNDYLSVYADNKYHVSPIFGPQYPYPEGEERKKINAAFGEFFQAMKEEGYWDKLNTFAKAMFAAMRKQMGPILKAAGEFESGQIVSYDGKPAVYCEDKHGKAKLIVKGSSGPEFDFVPVGELEPYDGDIPEDFERYAGHWETLQGMDVTTLLKAANLEEAFADLLKAGTEGKVLVPMTIIRGGKAVRTHRWMNPKDAAKPDRGRVNKDSEGNTVVSIGKKSKTYQALIPSKETFKAIQGGDADALANYLQEKFWTSPIQTEQDIKTPFGVEKRVRPESGSVTVVNQLAAAFRKSKIEGYDLEDLVQETALSLLENQSNGKLQNVAYDKFPSYIASTMANLNRNLRRKSRIDKQVGTAIDDMAEYLSGGGDVAEAYEVAEAQQIVKKTTDRVKERLMDWIETTGVRNKKDVPVVKSVVNQYFRGRSSQAIANSTGVDEGKVRNWVSRYVTSNRQLDKIARDAGYSGRTAVKDFIDDWRQVNNFNKAVLVRRGNLILRKADKGGDDWSGDESNEHGVFEKIDLHGLGIAIENPVGSIRSGVDENGVPWEIQMDHAYGFIMNTEGMDGEEIDVFVGPYQNSENVYVITIRDPKEGVEDKVFLGYRSGKEAMETFESHYSNPYDFVDKVSEYTLSQFLQAISSGKKSLAKAKAEVGETRTRKDGRKYRKVSEGQWELVSEGQGAGKKDAPGSQNDKQGQDQKGSKGGEAQGPKESFKRRMADAVKNFVKNLAGALEDTFAGDSSVGGISETTGGLGEAAKKETEARDANRAKNKADTDAAEKKAKDKLAGGKDK